MVNLVALLINIGLNLWWVPVLGIEGAAWATVATEAFVLVDSCGEPPARSKRTALRPHRPHNDYTSQQLKVRGSSGGSDLITTIRRSK